MRGVPARAHGNAHVDAGISESLLSSAAFGPKDSDEKNTPASRIMPSRTFVTYKYAGMSRVTSCVTTYPSLAGCVSRVTLHLAPSTSRREVDSGGYTDVTGAHVAKTELSMDGKVGIDTVHAAVPLPPRQVKRWLHRTGLYTHTDRLIPGGFQCDMVVQNAGDRLSSRNRSLGTCLSNKPLKYVLQSILPPAPSTRTGRGKKEGEGGCRRHRSNCTWMAHLAQTPTPRRPMTVGSHPSPIRVDHTHRRQTSFHASCDSAPSPRLPDSPIAVNKLAHVTLAQRHFLLRFLTYLVRVKTPPSCSCKFS